MTTIPQTTTQLTYYIRAQWIKDAWCPGAGYNLFWAVDAATHHVLPGTDDTDEANVRWRMKIDYPWYAEKGAVTA